MKQLTCEMCGSTDLVKQDGVFVCQSCGCKYSIEEAKKMMIDGTVEVTGTVKVDSSDRIANMLVNAKRAYADQKFSEAERLFGDVLNEDTENPTAILYQGLALGWQGNTVRFYMDKVGAAAERALDIAHLQMGDGKEFENFAIDALKNIGDISQGMTNLCMKNQNEAIERATIEIKRHGQRTSLYSSYAEWLKESNDIQDRMNKAVEQAKTIAGATWFITLSVYDKVLSLMSKVENYSIKTFKEFDKNFEAIAGLANNLDQTKVKTKADNLSEKAKSFIENHKKNSIKKYWDEHKEEKEKLDSELSLLEKEKSNIEDRIADLKAEIKALKKKGMELSPEENERNEYKEQISNLSRERNNLGLFKGKEKKAIDARISELQSKVDQLETVANEKHDSRTKEFDGKIEKVNNSLKGEEENLSNIEKRISSVLKRINLEDSGSKNEQKTSNDVKDSKENELKALEEDLAFLEGMLKEDIERHKETTHKGLYDEEEKTINLEKENIKKIKERIAEIQKQV